MTAKTRYEGRGSTPMTFDDSDLRRKEGVAGRFDSLGIWRQIPRTLIKGRWICSNLIRLIDRARREREMVEARLARARDLG